MDFIDSSSKLMTATRTGDWPTVLASIGGLCVPADLLVDLYEHICTEFIENGELEVTQVLLYSTNPLGELKTADPVSRIRFDRLETALSGKSFPMKDPYRGQSRQSRRDELAEKLSSFTEIIPSGRLIALLGDSIRYRCQTRSPQGQREKFDVLRGLFHSDTTTTFVSTLVTQLNMPEGSRPETLAFHPKGGYLVIGSSDGLVEVYSEIDWALARDLPYQSRGEFLIHDTCITALSFDPSGAQLATGDKCGRVCIWDFVSGDRRRVLQSSPRGVITSLRLDSDTNRIYVASDDGVVRVHGLKSGSVLKEFKISDSISSHGIFSTTGFFYSGGTDGVLRAYECETGRLHNEVTFPRTGTHVIRGVDVTYCTEYPESVIVTYDSAPSILFDMSSGVVLREFSTPGMSAGESFAFSFRGSYSGYLYCISHSGRLYCFDIDSGKLLNVVTILKGEVISAVHHPTRPLVSVGFSDGTICVIGK